MPSSVNFLTEDISVSAGQLGTIETAQLTEIGQSSPNTTVLVEHSQGGTAVHSPSGRPQPTIRSSLQASTWDGVFATVFTNITGGVLLSNFLLDLHATPGEIGLLASIPLLMNLLQPLGAYLANKTNSRHHFGLWIYGPSRLLWLLLAGAIAYACWHPMPSHQLIQWTLGIVLVTHILNALGSASWLSWLAALVPQRLRGRYFGWRNCAASLTSLISVPLVGLAVSRWPGGSMQGYGVLLLLGVIAGLVSVSFQFWMVDVNPQLQQSQPESTLPSSSPVTDVQSPAAAGQMQSTQPAAPVQPWFKNRNFLVFALYFGLWMFAVNLSAPFFNVYLLDNLKLDLSQVTLYNGLMAGANLVMMLLWGRLADRIGNRPLLLVVGVLVAVTPLLWLGVGAGPLSAWLWLPLIHLLSGGTWAAIELCTNNIQLELASPQQQAHYFAVAGAIAGVAGACGTTAGGYLAQFSEYGGFLGLFALSSGLRLVALLPLVFVYEQRSCSLLKLLQRWSPIQVPTWMVEQNSLKELKTFPSR